MKIGLKEDRCSGCRVCEMACSLSLFQELNPKKSAIVIGGEFPAPGRYHISVCDQCGQCAEVCPVECITLGDNGAYLIDREACTGCLACVEACPTGAMRTHPEETVPFKCTLCGDCVQLCPRSAVFDLEGDPAGRRWY
ncbi:MAG TPA: 4Fe-4S binding protein [Firmicutes bacterium]|nr:4Fe-4S binding protein [Bacillota bacterium]